MKNKIQWKALVAFLFIALGIGLLSRLFIAEKGQGWIATIAAILIAFLLYPLVSVFLLKDHKKRYQVSRFVLAGLVLVAGWLYYNTWNNNVCTVNELFRNGNVKEYKKRNIITGKQLIDAGDTTVQRLVKEKQWNSVFEYYGTYNAADIWTNDSIAAAKRKLNLSLALLTVLVSLLAMHTIESLLFRKKGNEGAHEQVFISYNHKNKPTALQLAALLKEEGIETIIDVERNIAGDKINKDFIRRSVYDSAIILLLVSKESLLSGWVSIEAVSGFFLSELDTRRKIIPCSLDDSFREKGFGTEAIRQINEQIAELDADNAQRGGAATVDNDAKRKRLVKLRDNLSDILENLDETLCVDISGDKLRQNFPQILRAVKTKFEENRDGVV
jgi:hypothetical protein